MSTKKSVLSLLTAYDKTIPYSWHFLKSFWNAVG